MKCTVEIDIERAFQLDWQNELAYLLGEATTAVARWPRQICNAPMPAEFKLIDSTGIDVGCVRISN